MIDIGFAREPHLFWGITVFAAVLCFAFGRKSRSRSGWNRLRSYVLRCMVLLFLIGALCKPFTEEPGNRTLLPIYTDISDSLDEGLAQETLARAATAASTNGVARLTPFGETVSAFDERSSAPRYTRLKDGGTALNIGKTSIEAALRHAIQNDEKTILLVSDGFETVGSVNAVIPLLKQNGIQVYPFIPEQFSAAEKSIRLMDIRAPLIAKKQQAVRSSIALKNSLQAEASGTLVVTVDGETSFEETISIPANEEMRVTVPLSTLGEGIKEVVAEFRPQASAFPSSSARTYISGEKREKILLLSGSQEDGQYLDTSLADQQFQLVHQYAGRLNLKSLEKLSEYSVILLNNIALNELPQSLPANIKQYVSKGGGFVMIGGNNSYGLGGYKDTSIADILPVHIVPPQKEKKRLNIAVQLVLDKSGSMKNADKMLFSKMAAVQVVDSLKPDDYLGIIGFDSTPFELLPIAQVGTNRDKAKKRVQLMFPGTTTKLLPALDLARRRLEFAKAGRKHMIILTDGKIPDGPARRPHYLQLVDEMRRTGITVSTFMIGSDQDFILREMADVGGGAFYRTRNVSNLPRLFLDDIKVSTGERTQKEAERFDVRKGDGRIVSTSLNAFPIVRGYVQTKRREKANLELVAYANRKAEPLLASWKFEKGRSIAYTSDVSGRWSYYWVGWPRFHSFWSDVIDTAKGSAAANETVQFELNHYVKGGSLFIETTVFSTALPGALQMKVESSDGKSALYPLNSLALGHYVTRVDNITAGTYTATLVAGEKELTPAVLALSGELFGERKGQGYNIALLSKLAEATGGSINPGKQVLERMQEFDVLKTPLDTFFIFLALFFLLLEIFIREVGLRFFSRQSLLSRTFARLRKA